MTTETQPTIPAVKSPSPILAALKNELATVNRLREGEVVEATLLSVTPRGVFFDLGKIGTGIVYGAELQNARQALKAMEPGARIHARIQSVDGVMGYVELSLAAADKQKGWQQAQGYEESGELVTVKVTGANQGGLIADLFGLKAFIPASQLSAEHAVSAPDNREKVGEELKKFIGQELTVKVITVNQRNNKLILSEREQTGVSDSIKEALAKYTVGQVIEGVVSGIADFGIFVKFTDNPEIEGLVHISEIDHRIIDSPKEVVAMSESVQVKIIDIKEGRVFLSLKALKPDPWDKVSDYYSDGQDVQGTVRKLNPFGAIVNLDHGIQGMVHISEFGGQDEMRKVISVGESYPFVIGSIKKEDRRLILKAKK